MFLKPVPPSQSQHVTVDTSDATWRLQNKLQQKRSLLDTVVDKKHTQVTLLRGYKGLLTLIQGLRGY